MCIEDRISTDKWVYLCNIYRNCSDGSGLVSFREMFGNKYVSDSRVVLDEGVVDSLLSRQVSVVWLANSLYWGRIPVVYALAGYITYEYSPYRGRSVIIGKGDSGDIDCSPLYPLPEHRCKYISLPQKFVDGIKSLDIGKSYCSVYHVYMNDNDIPMIRGYYVPKDITLRGYGRGDPDVDRVLECVCGYLDETGIEVDDIYWAKGYEMANAYILTHRDGKRILVVGY